MNEHEHERAAHPANSNTMEKACADLRTDRPDLDPSPILHALRDFAAWRGEAVALDIPASREEMEGYLADCATRMGDHLGAARLSRLQPAAVVLWGMPYATMIGLVLRRRLSVPKVRRRSKIDAARMTIGRLPSDWQGGLIARLRDEPGARKTRWSDDHCLAVGHALLRWLVWCESIGHDLRPSGLSFHAYACDLAKDGVSTRSAADYLGRIQSGFRTAREPGFDSIACDHVLSRLNAQAKREGSPTKTGDQLVGASTIYDLGMHLIDEARERGPRALQVARDFRNGLLLSIAAALPQRARALSHLDMGSTVILLERPHIRVRLPGRVLKLREHEKEHGGYDKVIENSDLWGAIDEFHRIYRPMFDDGTAMFPSVLEAGAAVSSARLGCIVGNLTEEHLGVRISIHRVRDNVATEASEELRSGGYLAPALLDHRSAETTMASYDHAQGVRAARDYAEFLASIVSQHVV